MFEAPALAVPSFTFQLLPASNTPLPSTVRVPTPLSPVNRTSRFHLQPPVTIPVRVEHVAVLHGQSGRRVAAEADPAGRSVTSSVAPDPI